MKTVTDLINWLLATDNNAGVRDIEKMQTDKKYADKVQFCKVNDRKELLSDFLESQFLWQNSDLGNPYWKRMLVQIIKEEVKKH